MRVFLETEALAVRHADAIAVAVVGAASGVFGTEIDRVRAHNIDGFVVKLFNRDFEDFSFFKANIGLFGY